MTTTAEVPVNGTESPPDDEVLYDETPRLMIKLDPLQRMATQLAEQQSTRLTSEAEGLENQAKALRNQAHQTMVAIVKSVFEQVGEAFTSEMSIRIERNERGEPGVYLWDAPAVETPVETKKDEEVPPTPVKRGAIPAPPLPLVRKPKMPPR